MSDNLTPSVGDRYWIDGQLLEIIHFDEELVTLSHLESAKIRYLRNVEFMNDLSKGSISLALRAPAVDSLSKLMLDPSHPYHSAADRKYFYVSKIHEKQGDSLPKERTLNLVGILAIELSDPKQPCYATICHWMRLFREGNYQRTALIKKLSTTPRGRRLSDEVKSVIQALITSDYESDERPHQVRIAEYARGEIEKINLVRQVDQSGPNLQLPSNSSVKRLIRDRCQRTSDDKRHGKSASSKKHGFSKQRLGVESPLERAQADSHLLDIFIVDENKKVLGKIAWIVAFFDEFSRVVLGWHISISSPCAETAIRALRMALEQDPDNDELRGRPKAIFSDRGTEFRNHRVMDTASRFRISVTLPPPKMPNSRAELERFWLTLEYWLQEQAGTTFSDIDARGDYNPGEKAFMTIDTLNTHVSDWIKIYHHRKHRSLGMPPRTKFLRGMKRLPPAELYPKEVLDSAFRLLEFSSLSNNRAQFLGLSWTGPNLSEIKSRLHNGQKALCHYDPSDLGEIWVSHPHTPHEHVRAFATNPAYQNNLTLSEHEAIQAINKQQDTEQDASSFNPELELYNLRLRVCEERENSRSRKKLNNHNHPTSKPESTFPDKRNLPLIDKDPPPPELGPYRTDKL